MRGHCSMYNFKEFIIKPAFSEQEKVVELFREYTDMLVENDPVFASYLELQNFDHELEDLQKKYAPPKGRLFVAMLGEKAAGCIGLIDLNGEGCELKRLYVKPEYRGRGLARELTRLILDEGKKAGYDYMLLDTLPFLGAAQALYRSVGFYEIEKYNNSPMDNATYMRYDFK